jgi:hypothetical protein
VRTTVQMRVLLLSIAGVLVSAAVLGVLQYRSLAQLEVRTRANFQDDLVKAAQGVAQYVENDVRSIAGDVLGPFRKADSDRSLREIANRFQELRRRRPEIAELFLFTLDNPNGAAAVFSNGNGAERFT